MIVVSSDVAITRRRRAYFTNIDLPKKFEVWDMDKITEGYEAIDGDEFIIPGRRLAKFAVSDSTNLQI